MSLAAYSFLRIELRQQRRRRSAICLSRVGARRVWTGPTSGGSDSVADACACDVEVHLPRRRRAASPAAPRRPACSLRPSMERAELRRPGRARCAACSASLLLDQRVRHRDLVLVQEIRQRAVPFRAVADDRRRLAVARPVAELLERRVDAVVLRGVDAVHLPVERREHRLELRHREHHAVRDVELAVVAVDHHAQVVEVLLARVHDRFPDRAFLQLAVAGQAVGSRSAATMRPGDREALRHARSPGPSARWRGGRRQDRARDGR